MVYGGRSRFRTVAWAGVAMALVLAAAAVAIWRRPVGADADALELVALGSDGGFGSDVELAPSEDGADGYPLILAVNNTGRRAQRPRSLDLLMPSWVRLVNASGEEITVERSEAEPLARVRLEFEAESVEPDAFPLVLAGLDQLRIEFTTGATNCRLSWDGVPDFGPAPPWAVERLSAIAVYWTLGTAGGRQAGLLRVHVPVASLPHVATDMEFGEPTRYTGAAPRPAMDSVALEYSLATTCGEPERPLDLTAMAWRSLSGALMIAVQNGEQTRIQLFDVDNDGRIDLEIRDTDADGVFETRRPVSYAIPAFLTPRS